MKKSLTILFLLLSHFLRATDYYVKNGGSDAASGLSDALAWETITKVNTVWAAGTFAPGDRILFNRGDKWSGVTLVVTESGTLANRITVGAYGTGTDPIISGFETIAGWSDQDTIHYKVITPASAPNMVKYDGTVKRKGRWPAATWMYYESHTGATQITDNQLGAAPDWDAAEIVIATNEWSIERRTITNHTGTSITWSPATYYTPENTKGYFIQNDIRTLNSVYGAALGEWYYNSATTTLYVYFGAELPTDHVVEVAVIDKLVSITGYNYITFDNIDFRGANTQAIYLSNADYITVNNCSINYTGGTAIYAASASTYLTVDSCTINNSCDNGIQLTNDINSYPTITYTTIDSTGLNHGLQTSYWSGYGIQSYGANTTCQYNQISYSGYTGIHFKNSNVTVDKNYIIYSCMSKEDGAGIYFQGSGFTGITITNNIIKHGGTGGIFGNTNVIHGVHGIYLDNNAENATVTNNTVAHNGYSGIYLHNAHDNIITNNVAYDNIYPQLYMSADAGLDDIEGNTITGNYFIAKGGTYEIACYAKTYEGELMAFGTFDNNYYARPIDDDYVFLTRTLAGVWSDRTLAQWKVYMSQDAASVGSPIAIADTTEIDFYSNYSAAPVVQPVTNMIDMDTVKYAANYTIPAWSSVVLLEDPDPVVAPPDPPAITTSAVTRLPSMRASGGGNCTFDGNGTLSAVGICWNTTGDPTTSDSKTNDATAEGAFTSTMTGLSPNTTYYIRAYATNETATSYGYEVTYVIGKYVHGSSGKLVKGSAGKIVIDD